MNRKWQRDAAEAFASLVPFKTFCDSLPPLMSPLGLATTADVYAIYSVLHAKQRSPELRVASSSQFYYLLADVKGGPEQQDPTAPPLKEPVIPVSKSCSLLHMAQLQSLFQSLDSSCPCQHVVTAIADADGSVSMVRLFNYIQAPFEGPETLPLTAFNHSMP